MRISPPPGPPAPTTATTQALQPLTPHQTYSWQVTARNACGTTPGPVWSFQTTDVPNHEPEMTSTPPSIEDRVYTYTVQATDPDADPLTFALSQAPAGMTLDLSTGHLTWEPTLAQQGRHQVEIQVSDGRGGVDSQAFALTVRAELLTSATIGLYQGFDVESGQAVCDPQALVLTRGTMTETTEILLPAIPAGFDFPGAPHCYFAYERSSGGNLLLVLEPGVTAVLLNVPYEDVDQSDIVGLTPWTAGKPVVSSQTAIVKTAGGKYVKIGNIRDHPATWTVSFDYEELVVPQP